VKEKMKKPHAAELNALRKELDDSRMNFMKEHREKESMVTKLEDLLVQIELQEARNGDIGNIPSHIHFTDRKRLFGSTANKLRMTQNQKTEELCKLGGEIIILCCIEG
jgi:hypothetical protein